MKKILFTLVLLCGISITTPVQATHFTSDWFNQPHSMTASTMNAAGLNTDRFNSFQNDFAVRQNEFKQNFQSKNQQATRSFEQRQSDFFSSFSSRFPSTNPDNSQEENGSEDDQDEENYEVPAACTINNLSQITNFPPQSGPIIALGNSLTSGVGASPGEDFVSELEEMSGRNIINAGVPGDTTADALERLDEDVLQLDPSAVLVFLGGNDILYRYYNELSAAAEAEGLQDVLVDIIVNLFGKVPEANTISEAETFANLKTIVEEIQSTGAVVILVGINGSPFNTNVADEYQRVANETGSILVPNALNGIVGNSSRMSDLIHPNDVGYDILADRIYRALSCVE